jgi:hypothetical protein
VARRVEIGVERFDPLTADSEALALRITAAERSRVEAELATDRIAVTAEYWSMPDPVIARAWLEPPAFAARVSFG